MEEVRIVTRPAGSTKLFGRRGVRERPLLIGQLYAVFVAKEQDKGRQAKLIDETQRVFDEVKRWFFEEIVPKYKVQRGDLVALTIVIARDGDRLIFVKEKSCVSIWRRDVVCGVEEGEEEAQ